MLVLPPFGTAVRTFVSGGGLRLSLVFLTEAKDAAKSGFFLARALAKAPIIPDFIGD